jgi:mevalonate kinase
VAQANGKVILLGEHAVVYGVPALAAGIDRGARARAEPAERARLRMGTSEVLGDDGSELGRALSALLDQLGLGPHALEVELDLPPGAGLGASAALGVAIARAVLEAQGEPGGSSERVLAAADAWERVFHGNPSGIDAAAAAHSGCFLYSRTGGVQKLPLARDFQLAIALSGPPASTREMVESVARLRERRPELVDKTMAGIGALVQNARVALETGDLVGLGRLLDLNQMLLSGLFLSTEGIERACAVARGAGALGAKLTGSGGGGAVMALVAGDPAPVLTAFAHAGFESFATRVRANRVLVP